MQIPRIGLGTWKLRGSPGRQAVETALDIGYRHIDTADYYRNHDIIGAAVKAGGIPRNELFLTTKIFPPLTSGHIAQSGPRFLRELQTDYIDLLLVHWPDDRPVPQVLKDFELLKKAGITRHIGVSNFSIRQMREALASGIVVYNHQFHIYPGSVNRELITYCQDNHVSVTAYSPLDEGRVVNDRKLSEAARQQGITPARAALKQLLALGLIVIPKASKREHLEENFAALSGGDRDGQS